MKNKEKVNLKNFEMLTNSTNGRLVGGFSVVGSSGSVTPAAGSNDRCTVVNNCNGGNCTVGCGTGGSN